MKITDLIIKLIYSANQASYVKNHHTYHSWTEQASKQARINYIDRTYYIELTLYSCSEQPFYTKMGDK